MVKDTKLYDILQVPTDATDMDIKKAYKNLSRKWHPDKNPDNKEEATTKFQEISEAYAILGDPEKREAYDRHGKDNINMPHFDPSDLFNAAFGGGTSFENMFGGGHPFFRGRNGNSDDNCVVEQLVTLEELYSKKKVSVKYTQKNYCVKCNETGTKDGYSSECSGCKGQGKKFKVIKQGPAIQQFVSLCDECNGSGEKISKDNICSECNGKKYITRDVEYIIQLERHMSNNDKMMIENMGHQYKNRKTHLIVVLKEQPHNIFKRQGRDLHMDIKLRLYQSLYGFTKMITHLDGRQILLKYNKMSSQMNTIMKVKNEGMGGHLILHISTMMPKLNRLDDKENEILRKLLVKAHLAEYQKEQTILENSSKMDTVNLEEISQSQEQNEQEHQPQFEGVQCAQQ